MDDKKFLFAYVTHNGKYKCKAYRLGNTMTSPVQLIITNTQTEKTTSSHCSGEREATKQWKLLSKANLKEDITMKPELKEAATGDTEKLAMLIKAARRLITTAAKVDMNYRVSPDAFRYLLEAVIQAEKE